MSNNTTIEQTKRPVRKRPLTPAEMRSKASYRAMEKLLEDTITEEHRLWSIARVMSDEEFLSVAEERTLANTCGNPLCSHSLSPDQHTRNKGKYKIDTVEKKVYTSISGPQYCSEECSDVVALFAVKLGSVAQASHRFNVLLDQVQQKRAAVANKNNNGSAIDNGMNSDQSASQVPDDSNNTEQHQQPEQQQSNEIRKLKSALKKTNSSSEYAAGTSKVPIMSAEVKERAPPAQQDASELMPRFDKASKRAQVIEGYVPKAHRQAKRKESKVRFEDDDIHNNNKDNEPSIIDNSITSNNSNTTTTNDNTMVTTAGQSGQPVFVFDVEDASSPIEGSGHPLDAKFGRLRLVDDRAVVVDDGHNNDNDNSSMMVDDTTDNDNNTTNNNTTTTTNTSMTDVEAILTERLRQGVSKYFPQLAKTLPEELQKQLDDDTHSYNEYDDDDDVQSQDDDDDWMLSDDESDDDEYNHDGDSTTMNNKASTSSFGKQKLSFFGELYRFLDSWITESTYTMLILNNTTTTTTTITVDDNDGDDDNNTTTTQSSLPSSVPEVRSALERFIAFALPTVIDRMHIGVPKNEIERSLSELIRTFSLVSALPAFTTVQWQVVVLVLLKALSMHHLATLQPVFETREGISRLNKMLGVCLFTVEEFYAALELLLDPEA